tara:strand:+ start:22 stop:306 length:285 start_codon:yes stop_codon:yes gene_type:complete
VSKKKSYMDTKNIIKEGFIEKLIKAVMPTSLRKSMLDTYLKNKKAEIAKVEKDLQKSYQKSEKIYQDYRKWYKKKYGKDIGPSSIPKKYLKGVE